MRKSVWVVAAVCAVVLLASAAATVAQEPAQVAGKWEMTAQGPQGTQTSTMTIEQDGGKIKGRLEGQRGGVDFEGTIKGKEISFTVKRQTPQGEVVVEYTGTVDGDSIKGTRKGPRGSTEWSAKRMK